MKQVAQRSRVLPAWLWFMHAVTGVGLAIFVIIHMLDVSTVIWGQNVYNWFADFLETGFMATVTTIITWLVGIALVLHAANGIRIASRPYLNACKTVRHSRGLRHKGTWYWVMQVVSGSTIVAFGVIHWFWLHAIDQSVVTFKLSMARMQHCWFTAFYAAFLLFLLYHTVNGVRAVLVKLGYRTEKGPEGRLQRCVFSLGALFLVLGILSLIMFRVHA